MKKDQMEYLIKLFLLGFNEIHDAYDKLKEESDEKDKIIEELRDRNIQLLKQLTEKQ